MKLYYFIIKNGKKEGPYRYEELSEIPLFGNDDIWRSDKDKWQKVNELEEFDDYVIAQPPPSPIEVKHEEKSIRIEYFKKVMIKKSMLVYLVFCLIITLIRFAFVVISYEQGKESMFRYPEYRYPNSANVTETMYGNQEEFLFRALKPKTIYLSSEEQNSYEQLLWNLYLSNIISLFSLYIIIMTYLYFYILKVELA
jgi:hypothetical protein